MEETNKPVSPEGMINEETHPAIMYRGNRQVVEAEIALKALELLREEHRREIEEIINRLRQTFLNKEEDLGLDYDYGLKTAIGIIKLYLTQKVESSPNTKEKGE